MTASEYDAARTEVGLDEARGELERLLGDARFHATDRAKRILRYIAEKCFEGEQTGVKAYAIALDVLNRSERFDTGSDPIVRIEISRLRSALANYYDAYGATLEVIVQLPVGRYLAVFTRSAAISASCDDLRKQETGEIAEPAARSAFETSERAPASRGRHSLKIGAALVILVAAGSAGALIFKNAPATTSRPSVSVSMSSADDGKAAEADSTLKYLVAALSQFRTLDISAKQVGPRAGRIETSYEIQMKYYADDDNRTIWWQVVDGRDRTILKSGIDKVQIDGRSEVAVRDELVSALAKRFASTRGIISNLEAHADTSSRSLGNACILRGEIALDEGGRQGIAASEPCLQRTLVAQPNNADAMAVLSRVLVARTGADPESTDFDYATTLANRAVSVDPRSDRAYVALMMAHFYAGKTETAIAAGNKALAINPNNPDVLAKLAGVLYSSGFQKAAVTLAEEASNDVEAVPRDARIVLALDAYGREDWSNASLVSEQINCSDFVVRAIRAASLGEMASPDAARSLAFLRQAMPDYKTAMRTSMERRRYPDDVIAGLEKGLGKAEVTESKLALATD
ncbi:hypothetical protein [Neorhizobium alkalisoli]|uniref:Uncharacterized protein n=1 Tax=Neorhizobium alkalisoli TaxID=528178 RepID=A0A561QBS0_9HYPH|nr:hypothetical protein [Neorhizobium alkalisoli]TWF47820.1 hypothetical protein FHW37_110117 [Neorhizobium alkalisoli]